MMVITTKIFHITLSSNPSKMKSKSFILLNTFRHENSVIFLTIKLQYLLFKTQHFSCINHLNFFPIQMYMLFFSHVDLQDNQSCYLFLSRDFTTTSAVAHVSKFYSAIKDWPHSNSELSWNKGTYLSGTKPTPRQSIKGNSETSQHWKLSTEFNGPES